VSITLEQVIRIYRRWLHEDMSENGLARCNGTVVERGVQIDILRSSVGFTLWSDQSLVDVRCVLETGTLSGDVAVVG